jgi:hydroxypyruvate isomerase
MTRRELLKNTVAAAAATAAMGLSGQPTQAATPRRRDFKLKYAPHFGMFKHLAGEDHIDQLKFMADQGFTALEDNGMMGRPVELQEKIAREMSRLGMTMGVFVSYAEWSKPTMVENNADVRAMLVKQMKAAVEVAKRVNAKWSTVVPGPYNARVDWDYQTANLIDNLKACAEVCEPAGLVLVLEPLNPRDHPGLVLTKISQAYQICRAVGSPSCKILNDLYHQQITEGNLIPNIDNAWSEIAYFQVGDNPGRREPTTGEINYHNVFRHIHRKGFTGIVGMEHGKARDSKEGEQAVIDAYVKCDDF